ncbi:MULTISPECIES: DUF2059 domain-containing protein [Alteromonadaceae]|jgi:hypothetical protein|uniref:DUF2059 domain-containing protein n=1 Tax=Brumicola blandensis TaxID=3075611 RepID=A0AAW8R6Z1_9ALTE|nr:MULTISPECIES: DUF2059 domain-containing protein [unclassified Alteromonas]MDT0584212.1 DUF2059 domain-containing protein [Alteromonas sp. W409]MDT0629681.1 DUF2059 domain-containing protein [Alteromonas sp. W364]
MKRILIALSLVTVLVGNSQAQTTDETLEQLFDIMAVDETIDVVFEQMQSMVNNISGGPILTSEEQEVYDKYQLKILTLMKKELAADSMRQDLAQIYKQNFSDKELKDMLAFYQSPTGQSMLEKMPIVTQESMQASQRMMTNVMPKINALTEEMSKEMKEARTK